MYKCQNQTEMTVKTMAHKLGMGNLLPTQSAKSEVLLYVVQKSQMDYSRKKSKQGGELLKT